MPTKAINLDPQAEEIRRRFKIQIDPYLVEKADIDPCIRGFPKGTTRKEKRNIKERVVFLDAEIERLRGVEIKAIRDLYQRNNALASTLEELSIIIGKPLTEVESGGYHRCGGYAETEDGKYAGYLCRNCGWVASTPDLNWNHDDVCKICGSFVH